MEEPRDSPICNSIDRISNLPENLIHHILSFMDMTQVVHTCVLSKRWKNLWAITSILNLFSLAISNKNQNSAVPFQKFIKFVDQIFILRDNSNIQSVNLVCGKQRNFVIDISIMTASLTTWIVAAVRSNIQELYLDIAAVKISRFPQCLFTCTSLIKLELKLGGNSSIIVLPSSMDLLRLTFMNLDSLPSDVNLTNRLFSKCPVLESLIIKGRLGHMDLQISSLTLKHLTMVDFVSKSKVKVDAPNLVYFKCRDFISKLYFLENLVSLVTADIYMSATKDEAGKIEDYTKNHWLFLTALSNAKEIRLSEWFLCLWARGFFAASCKNSLQFSNLRLVKLKSYLPKYLIRALGWLLCISPNVESLSIVNLGMSSKDIPDSEDFFAGVPLDHLRFVEIRGLLGHFNELKLVEIIFKKAVVLEKMLLFSCKKSTTGKCLTTFGEKLLTLPRASSNITTFLI
ncbi:F-box protein At4g22280-like isoform X1 [Papaver somniferum]|uniref:F-box protein At4g22280-like isoform X1 n=1 Tax=Papaver somniferum TaxID=3469 RepID=UPI000E6FE099|nr:F-box protein At4g22280-like isoform X1 [Papaver somniferum]